MTGETIRDLLKPLIGKSGSISMIVSRTGHIGIHATENTKLTGVEVRPDGLVRLERETGWAVIDPGEVVAVVGQRAAELGGPIPLRAGRRTSVWFLSAVAGNPQKCEITRQDGPLGASAVPAADQGLGDV